MTYWYEIVTFLMWPLLIWASFALSKMALRRFERRHGTED